MDFATACEAANRGHIVRRPNWPPGIQLAAQNRKGVVVPIKLVGGEPKFVDYREILANDWLVLPGFEGTPDDVVSSRGAVGFLSGQADERDVARRRANMAMKRSKERRVRLDWLIQSDEEALVIESLTMRGDHQESHRTS